MSKLKDAANRLIGMVERNTEPQSVERSLAVDLRDAIEEAEAAVPTAYERWTMKLVVEHSPAGADVIADVIKSYLDRTAPKPSLLELADAWLDDVRDDDKRRALWEALEARGGQQAIPEHGLILASLSSLFGRHAIGVTSP